MASQKPALTINQACIAFGVSSMCLHSWRKGTPTKDPLPVLATEGRTVLIGVADARKWAKAHKVEFAVNPDEVLADVTTSAGKPGPKTKATEKPVAKKAVKPVAKKSALAPVKAKPRKNIGKAIAAVALLAARKASKPAASKATSAVPKPTTEAAAQPA